LRLRLLRFIIYLYFLLKQRKGDNDGPDTHRKL
jgi:hypothetical protein